jgi:phosphoglycerate kinase
MLSIHDVELNNKRVLVREDFNVPMQSGRITDDTRLKAALPSIQQLHQQQAKIILLSHLGRPKEGNFDKQYSLAPVAQRLQQLLNHPVRLVEDWTHGVNFQGDEILLLENIRFMEGEKANATDLASKLANLCDVFVMDAFATAHRKQASTYGVAEYAPIACAGPLLLTEVDALSHALANPARPLLAIVGGAKISSKLTLLDTLLDQVDQLIVGGGIANTFLAAQGFSIGQSLCEVELIPTAKQLLDKAQNKGIAIPLPSDVVVATEFSVTAQGTIKPVHEINDNEMILDIGPHSSDALCHLITQAQTILWNGPVGVFEYPAFAQGTQAIAQAIAQSSAYSIAGGGDTLAAVEQFGISQQISYISTGGGAFLEYVEGKTLPAIDILQQRAKALTTC